MKHDAYVRMINLCSICGGESLQIHGLGNERDIKKIEITLRGYIKPAIQNQKLKV